MNFTTSSLQEHYERLTREMQQLQAQKHWALQQQLNSYNPLASRASERQFLSYEEYINYLENLNKPKKVEIKDVEQELDQLILLLQSLIDYEKLKDEMSKTPEAILEQKTTE